MAAFAGVAGDGGDAEVERGLDGLDERGFAYAAVTCEDGGFIFKKGLELVEALVFGDGGLQGGDAYGRIMVDGGEGEIEFFFSAGGLGEIGLVQADDGVESPCRGRRRACGR